jgi:hypothetical protein
VIPRTCAGCGIPERRWEDRRGRPQVNLEPFSGLCRPCLTKRSAERQAEQLTFHSRLAARTGEVIDTRTPPRDPRDPPVFDPRAAAARNDD